MFDQGDLVSPTAGRDSGRIYMVVGIDEDINRVKVADGRDRTLRRPKRKNPNHLKVLAKRVCGRTVSRLQCRRASDSDIREAIERYVGTSDEERGGCLISEV